MLAFGGTRTHHRLMVAIEDAGWEIRDCLMWLYGSGFPKSLDLSKAIDKMQGAEREVVGIRTTGIGTGKGSTPIMGDGNRDITAPATDAAKQWEGWGTALNPAWEPIILARNPFPGTVAENVLQWGTGAINVDGCRVEMQTDDVHKSKNNWKPKGYALHSSIYEYGSKTIATELNQKGRWPANLLLDEESAAMLDEQSGELTTGANPTSRCSTKFQGIFSGFVGQKECTPARGADSGGASRFFYTAKADSTERNKHLGGMPAIVTTDGRENPIDNPFQRGETLRRNHHPTVKPVDLLRYLCKLITPPGGVILDPFAGSGSTGVAAFEEGFDYILIEKEPEYCQLARMRNAQKRIEEFA
jgi:site-specific DNA-methyltransferase (adenine-specific)